MKLQQSGFYFLIFTLLWKSNFAFDFYSENLLIRPLPNGDLQSIFNFTIIAFENNSIHIPWIFGNLFEQFSMEQFKLSMTQGFWRTNIWGKQQIGTETPTGTELWVKFDESIKNSSELWLGIVQTINGLFCTSILRIYPQFSGQPKFSSKNWWFGSLGGESVCTENVKSWKKLLPCKQSGLIVMMEPTVLLSARFHSILIKIEKKKMANNNFEWEFIFLAKTVHDGELLMREFNDLSLQDLFDRKLMRKCPIANQSEIKIEQNEQFSIKKSATTIYSSNLSIINFKDWNEEKYLNIYFEHNIHNAKQQNLNGMNVHSFLKSTNQIGGLICTQIVNQFLTSVNAKFMHLIPWQIRIFLHTLTFTCSNLPIPIKKQSFSLARDGQRPLLIELEFSIPANSNCKIEMEYEAAFLKITDFPPDANNGIHIPGPILTIPSSTNANLFSSHFQSESTGLSKEMSDKIGYRLFGEPLLILLPVPDFSMPFNVICLICTTIAIYYGNAFALSTKLMKLVPKKKDKENGAKESIFVKMREKINGFLQKCLPGRFKKKNK